MLLKNKIEIENWLNKYKIEDYELIEDKEYEYVVNVKGNVELYNKGLKSIDVKFNIIEGYFRCSYNKLTSLEGCPEIVNGNFSCAKNKLESLEGSPNIVKGFFDCSTNELKSLVGCSQFINGWFYCNCNYNQLNLDGIKTLMNIEIKGHYIKLDNNAELNELQNIIDFNEIKKILNILNIYQEKAYLMKVVKVTDKSVESTDFVKVVEKINKI